jgi:hypothetical protein
METLWFGLASGIISFTIADMGIFERLRTFANRSKFFGKLIHCHYCLGFYISAIICIIYKPNLINQISVVDQILTYFIVCGISGVCGLIFKVLFWITERHL